MCFIRVIAVHQNYFWPILRKMLIKICWFYFDGQKQNTFQFVTSNKCYYYVVTL